MRPTMSSCPAARKRSAPMHRTCVFYARGEKVWPIHGPWWLRVRGEVGASWIDDFSDLPASQRFFAGGDRSVRGYGLNELSPMEVDPHDPEAGEQAVGGENKLVGSIEIERDFPHNLRGAIFFDTGNAFNDWARPAARLLGGHRRALQAAHADARPRRGAVAERSGTRIRVSTSTSPRCCDVETHRHRDRRAAHARPDRDLVSRWLLYTEAGLQFVLARIEHLSTVSIVDPRRQRHDRRRTRGASTSRSITRPCTSSSSACASRRTWRAFWRRPPRSTAWKSVPSTSRSSIGHRNPRSHRTSCRGSSPSSSARRLRVRCG